MRLDLKIPPVLVWAFSAFAIALSHRYLPSPDWPHGLRRGLLLLFWAVGGVIGISGVLAFRRARTTVNPIEPHRASTVVRTGIYRWTRNPMYLGLALGLAGIGLGWPSPGAPLAVLGFIAYITRFQIRPEEAALDARFGDEYRRYRDAVRRWL